MEEVESGCVLFPKDIRSTGEENDVSLQQAFIERLLYAVSLSGFWKHSSDQDRPSSKQLVSKADRPPVARGRGHGGGGSGGSGGTGDA